MARVLTRIPLTILLLVHIHPSSDFLHFARWFFDKNLPSFSETFWFECALFGMNMTRRYENKNQPSKGNVRVDTHALGPSDSQSIYCPMHTTEDRTVVMIWVYVQ